MKLTTLVKLNGMKATMIFNDIVVEGDEQSPLQKFFNKHGIVPEKISPSSKVNQIGFSEKEKHGTDGHIGQFLDSRLVLKQVLVKLDMKH